MKQLMAANRWQLASLCRITLLKSAAFFKIAVINMLTKRGEILDNLSAAALIDTYVRL